MDNQDLLSIEIPEDWNLNSLTEDDMKLSEYFARDFASINSSDPYLNLDENTTNILAPLVRATTDLPSNITTQNDYTNWQPSTVNEQNVLNLTLGNSPDQYSPTQISSDAFDSSSATSSPSLQFNPSGLSYVPSPSNTPNVYTALPRQIKQEPAVQLNGSKRNHTEEMFYLPQELQTPQDGNKSPSSDSSASDPSKRTKNEPEKAEKRKQQTRNASKLYRQRKKALEGQLNERLSVLEEEKRLLQNEQKNAEIMLRKLREENERLKTSYQMSSEQTAKTRIELLKKLEKQVAEGVDESTLSITIAEIGDCCKKCMDLGKGHLNQLISPSTVGQLVDNGYFQDKNRLEALARKGSLSHLLEKIRKEIKTLTNQQNERLDKELQQHHVRLEVIYREREELTNRIIDVFSELKNSKSDFGKFLETVVALEHLRKSMESEASEWSSTMQRMLGGTLTPLQMAQFLLKVEFQHASVCQLNNIWTTLNKNWATNRLAFAQ